MVTKLTAGSLSFTFSNSSILCWKTVVFIGNLSNSAMPNLEVQELCYLKYFKYSLFLTNCLLHTSHLRTAKQKFWVICQNWFWLEQNKTSIAAKEEKKEIIAKMLLQ